MSGEAVDPRPVQPDGAVGRPLQPDDDLQERALSGPVRTDDGDDLAVVDPERDAVDGREAAEALCDPVDLEEQTPPPGSRDGRASAAATGRSPSARTSSVRCSAPARAASPSSGSPAVASPRSSRPTRSTGAATRTPGC